MAIHLAVSILSPVNIHILTPAFRRSSKVILTSSCSLSSTPVSPSSSRSFSRYSATTSAIAPFRLSSLIEAAWYAVLNSSYVDDESFFLAITSVRSPSRAIFAVSSSSQSFRCTILLITTSAPFCKNVISPVCSSRTTIPMRLDSDVKGKISRTSKEISVESGVVNVIWVRERNVRDRPIDWVQLTMATSSGEEAW